MLKCKNHPFILKASRKLCCWSASLTALPLESLPPTWARKGLTVHAGDVVLQLASLWLRACGGMAAFTWSGRSQNVYPARILHKVNSREPVLRRLTATVTASFAYKPTVELIWLIFLQFVGCIRRYNYSCKGYSVIQMNYTRGLLSAEWYDYKDLWSRDHGHRAH